MKQRNIFLGALLSSSVIFVACSSGGGSSLIDPANPDDVTSGLTIKVGTTSAVLKSGSPPAASTDAAAPAIQSAPTKVLAANGADANAALVFNTSAGVSALFAKVIGASRYAEVDINASNSKSNGKAQVSLSINISIPDKIRDGTFCVSVSGRDSNGLVSQAREICYQVASTADDENSAAQIQSALQGTWFDPCDADGNLSFQEKLVISGNTITISDSEYANSQCTGTPSFESATANFTFMLGSEITTDSGLKARELDVFDANNEMLLSIVRVEGNKFFLGVDSSSPDIRPTQLNRNSPYTRSSGSGTGTPSTTPKGDQTWDYTISINGTVSGQSVNDTISVTQVDGFSVPESQAAGEQTAFNLSDAYTQGFEQACNQGFVENQPTRVDNFLFSQDGNGGVGTSVEGRIDIFVNGTCRNTEGDYPIDIDITYIYLLKRVS